MSHRMCLDITNPTRRVSSTCEPPRSNRVVVLKRSIFDHRLKALALFADLLGCMVFLSGAFVTCASPFDAVEIAASKNLLFPGLGRMRLLCDRDMRLVFNVLRESGEVGGERLWRLVKVPSLWNDSTTYLCLDDSGRAERRECAQGEKR